MKLSLYLNWRLVFPVTSGFYFLTNTKWVASLLPFCFLQWASKNLQPPAPRTLSLLAHSLSALLLLCTVETYKVEPSLFHCHERLIFLQGSENYPAFKEWLNILVSDSEPPFSFFQSFCFQIWHTRPETYTKKCFAASVSWQATLPSFQKYIPDC